jgi:CSLREA domain-containing protein
MRATGAHIARNIWGRIAIASLLIAELSAVPAVVPGVLPAAAAPPPTPSISVAPSVITAGESYSLSGTGFSPGQAVVLKALPACSNLPAGNPAKPGYADPTCDIDGGHPELFANGIVITPAADGSFSQSFFSSPLLSEATYAIVAKAQAPGSAASGESSDNNQRLQPSAAITVRAANPAVTLSTPIISNFAFLSATMTGFAPNELVCVADFTTFGNCTVANAIGTASIPLPPACILPGPTPTSPPTIICLHPIAEQARAGLLPMTTTVMAVGASSLRTATTALTIVPHKAALKAVVDTQAQSLTLTATGMLPNEGNPACRPGPCQGILFPRGQAEAAIPDPVVPGAAPTGHASHTYSLACPNPAFPAGTFSLGVFGFASNLSPQTIPDVTIPDMGCPASGQTLTASNTNLITGDTVTLTAAGFADSDLLTFSVEAPDPLTGGRLRVGPVPVNPTTHTASVDVKVDCCEELHSRLLTAVQNQDGSRSAFGNAPPAITRPVPIVNASSNFVEAGDPLTLSGSGYRANQAMQLFLGDLVPCKSNDPTLNNPNPLPKCAPIASPPPLAFRGVTNLGGPGVTTVNTDANGNFKVTVPSSYLAGVDGVSIAALPFDRNHPLPTDPGISIQHANGYVTVQRYHPHLSAEAGEGRTLAVDGSGFVPGEQVLIASGGAGRESLTTTADGSGNFSTNVALQPTAPTGTYALAATGQTSNLFATTPVLVNSKRALFRVNTTADAPQQPGAGANCASTLQGRCTLRAAIQAANFLGGGEHLISLTAPGIFSLTAAGAGEDAAATGDLDVNGAIVTITNASNGPITIDAGGADRVFDVGPMSPGQVSLTGLTIQNGSASVGGGIKVGGGSVLNLTNVTLTDNSATFQGGGLWNAGLATLTNSVVRSNSNTGFGPNTLGGGIFNAKTLTLNGVIVESNQILSGIAGGIANAPTGNMTLVNATIRGNNAQMGAGSLSAGVATLDHVTVTGNHATLAEAGFANGGNALLANILVSRNSSADINGGLGNAGFMTVTNGLITGNTAATVNGGFANVGSSRLENVTISGNTASSVAGVGNLCVVSAINPNCAGSLVMTNVTISGNHSIGDGGLTNAGLGGGLANGRIVTATNVTIASNDASVAGGNLVSGTKAIDVIQERGATLGRVLGLGAPLTLTFPKTDPVTNGAIETTLVKNTIVANGAGGDCLPFALGGRPILSLGFNLTSDSSCILVALTPAPDKKGVNPNLDSAVANNGGPALGDVRGPDSPSRGAVASDDVPEAAGATMTQALLTGSPAINAIPVTSCPPPGTDERGVARPQGAGCDIGAFEAN